MPLETAQNYIGLACSVAECSEIMKFYNNHALTIPDVTGSSEPGARHADHNKFDKFDVFLSKSLEDYFYLATANVSRHFLLTDSTVLIFFCCHCNPARRDDSTGNDRCTATIFSHCPSNTTQKLSRLLENISTAFLPCSVQRKRLKTCKKTINELL